MGTHHGYIHEFIASVKGHTHFNPYAGKVDADPLFPLFHAFLDYIRLMRTDCAQLDLVDSNDLDQYEPYSYQSFCNYSCNTDRVVDLDYNMSFSLLCNDTNGEGGRLCSNTAITPRLMYDISPNTKFDVVYELGDFWPRNDELRAECEENLNSTWWVRSDPDIESEYQFVSDRLVNAQNRISLAPMAVMVFGVVMVAVLKWWSESARKSVAVDSEYGSVEVV